jgi:hypothetical protein
MNENNDRRLFFKHLFSSASGFLNTLVPPDDPGNKPGMVSDIMGDLTPELLAMEAQRLGLDPKKDQNRVRQSIQAAMGRPGIEDTV